MKKRLLFGAIAALLLCGGVATAAIVSDNDQLSELTKENIGAFKQFQPQGPALNGPQMKYDCPGWFTGKGYRCGADNEYNCAQILCR